VTDVHFVVLNYGGKITAVGLLLCNLWWTSLTESLGTTVLVLSWSLITVRIAAKRQTAGIKFTHSPKIRIFKFSKISLGPLCTRGTYLCTYIAIFLCGVRWRHSRAPNS